MPEGCGGYVFVLYGLLFACGVLSCEDFLKYEEPGRQSDFGPTTTKASIPENRKFDMRREAYL